MLTTTLSSKGQIIIPKPLRQSHQWKTGQEFIVIETEEGLLLKPKNPFPLTTLDEVIATLHYEGEAKTLEEMEEAIQLGAMERSHDRS